MSYAGSMSKKTPETNPKGKGKKEDKPAPAYTPVKMKLTTQCFVDAKLLERRNTCDGKILQHPSSKNI